MLNDGSLVYERTDVADRAQKDPSQMTIYDKSNEYKCDSAVVEELDKFKNPKCNQTQLVLNHLASEKGMKYALADEALGRMTRIARSTPEGSDDRLAYKLAKKMGALANDDSFQLDSIGYDSISL